MSVLLLVLGASRAAAGGHPNMQLSLETGTCTDPTATGWSWDQQHTHQISRNQVLSI